MTSNSFSKTCSSCRTYLNWTHNSAGFPRSVCNRCRALSDTRSEYTPRKEQAESRLDYPPSKEGLALQQSGFQTHINTFNAFQVNTQASLISLDGDLHRLNATVNALAEKVELVARPSRNNDNRFGEVQGKEEALRLARSAFGWVEPYIINLILRDQLYPEHIYKLRKQWKSIGGDYETFGSENPPMAHFLHHVPTLDIFCQVWSVFVGVHSTIGSGAVLGYCKHLHDIIAKAAHHPWNVLADYHLEVHRKRIDSKASAEAWMHEDAQLFATILSRRRDRSAAPSPIRLGPIRRNFTPASPSNTHMSPDPRPTTVPSISSTICTEYNRKGCQDVCPNGQRHCCSTCYAAHSLRDCKPVLIQVPVATGPNSIPRSEEIVSRRPRRAATPGPQSAETNFSRKKSKKRSRNA